MDWSLLLNSNRFDDNGSEKTITESRSAFQRDFDRIIFSSAFRRMQDKTQVFPVPISDFVHNRLTHSLEVAMVGRSLGNIVGSWILENDEELKKNHNFNVFGDIVAAAALAHDLGNPPFGHFGEDAIQEYFLKNKDLLDKFNINEEQWLDFEKYEGNAHGFRLITNHHPDEIGTGMNLTYGTLATFAKYPRSAIDSGKENSKEEFRCSAKKFSYFLTEQKLFSEVAEKIGLKSLTEEVENRKWARHPLAFLVEAADNICYRIIDLEDGYKLGHLDINEMEELLKPLLLKQKNEKDTEKKYQNIKDNGEKVSYLRAKSINILINEVVDVFKENYQDIMNGDFDKELTDLISSDDILNEKIKDKNIILYNKNSVIEIELAGYEVIYGLLEKFMMIHIKPENRISKKLLQLLPEQFRANKTDNDYEKIMKIIDYIARMTDGYALNLHKRLTGQSLPK